MATIVLVHGGNISTGTWNRLRNRNIYPPGGLLGARCWDGTKAYLEAHGHRVFAPDLPDEHTHSLTDHIEAVCSLIRDNDLRKVVLVGHSYGGMVITGAADRMPERIRRMVYLDAAPPDPGESLFDLFVASGLDPLSFAGLEAAMAYVEKIRFDPCTLERLDKAYIRCTKSDFAGVTAAAQRKIAARPVGWTILELPSTHVPMASMPDRFSQLMDRMART